MIRSQIPEVNNEQGKLARVIVSSRVLELEQEQRSCQGRELRCGLLDLESFDQRKVQVEVFRLMLPLA